MEQKRILWITSAVGIFLLVVLGGALIIYSPKTNSPKSIAKSASITESAIGESDGWVSISPAEKVENLEKQENSSEEIADLTEVNDFSANKTEDTEKVVVNIETQNDKTVPTEEVINFNQQKNEQRVSELTVYAENATIVNKNAVQEKEPVIEEKIVIAEKKSPVKVVSSTKKTENVASVKPKTTQKEVKKVTPTKTVKEEKKQIKYWVQVASLTSRKNADSTRNILGENKIVADVFTYKGTNDKLYYRVRVGPYTTKSEAEFWKDEIAKIDSFTKSKSYVTSTVVE